MPCLACGFHSFETDTAECEPTKCADAGKHVHTCTDCAEGIAILRELRRWLIEWAEQEDVCRDGSADSSSGSDDEDDSDDELYWEWNKGLATARDNLLRYRAHLAAKAHEAAYDKRELDALKVGQAIVVCDYAQKVQRAEFKESQQVGWGVGGEESGWWASWGVRR